MSKLASKRISIFLSVDRKTVNEYFNQHDNSPLYKRQLSYDFEQYLNELLITYKRHTKICYKVTCKDEDVHLIKPFMHAVRRHYYMLEKAKIAKFQKFKKRTFRLLGLSFLALIFFYAVLPLIFFPGYSFQSTILNSIEVISWVVMWKPIDRLIFHWNPYLKEIALMHKLAHAEVIRIRTIDNVKHPEVKTNLQKKIARA
jgi:hypothetical protein